MGRKFPVFLFRFFSWPLKLFCFGVVAWQGHKCITRYQLKPQGVSITIQHIDKVPLPEVTVCLQKSATTFKRESYNDRRVNTSELMARCSLSGRAFAMESVWTNEYCPNATETWDWATTSLDRMVYGVRFYNRYAQGKSFYSRDNSEHKLWHPVDKFDRRCWQLRNPRRLLPKGSSVIQMRFTVLDDVRLYFHTPGVLVSAPNLYSFDMPKSGVNYFLKLTHEMFKMQDFVGQKCSFDPNYRRDECALKTLEQAMLEEIGCTTPAITGSPHFCTNSTLGIKAGRYFNEHLWRTAELRPELEACIHPCEFMDLRYDITHTSMAVRIINGMYSSKIYVILKPYVKETEAQFSYSFVSMVAELGGYVGLFLGMSFIQLEDVVKYFMRKW